MEVDWLKKEIAHTRTQKETKKKLTFISNSTSKCALHFDVMLSWHTAII